MKGLRMNDEISMKNSVVKKIAIVISIFAGYQLFILPVVLRAITDTSLDSPFALLIMALVIPVGITIYVWRMLSRN